MDAPVVFAGDRTKPPDSDESIRCTVSGCSCVCFTPGRAQLRSCDRCGHGWVAHALEKLQAQPPSSCGPVEVALPGLVFDLSSLVLYGTQAVPVRLKILLDRLYSILTPEQVSHILQTLGWSLGDYVRGYMLQYPSGTVLDRWLMVNPEEELLILKQFLRFGETRPIVELMTLQCLAAVSHLSDPEQSPIPKSCQSKTSTATERDGAPGVFRNTRGDSCLVAGVYRFEKNRPASHNDTVQHFENFLGGLSLLLPFHFPSSAHQCLVPSTKEFLPITKLARCLRKPSETKLVERQRQDVGKVEQENEPILQQPKGELVLKIKADPDKPNKVQSLWHQIPRFNEDSDLHKRVAKQENTSSLPPYSNSSFIPSVHSPISSSSSPPTKISQKLPGSSSSFLNPLPSFSSSFLCPFPTSSFSPSHHPFQPSSSSLHPLPTSLCSLPSPSSAGGRKGRVCCGVCGKSFYDKGTLKIHYNAVHLKIKHRCTVAGCTMVFSSLRSRNRHSANPNPRLHTSASRDAHIQRKTHTETQIQEVKQAHKNIFDTQMCRGKEISHQQWLQDDGHTIANAHILRKRLNGHTDAPHGLETAPQPNSPPPPPPPPLPWTLSQTTTQNLAMNDSRSNLHHQAPNLPPPTFLPAPTLGPPPSLVPMDVPAREKTEQCHRQLSLHTGHTDPLHGTIPLANGNDEPASHGYGVTEEDQGAACTSKQQQRESGDPLPKKKPRKSSMPVKIEREKWEGKRYKEEESC